MVDPSLPKHVKGICRSCSSPVAPTLDAPVEPFCPVCTEARAFEGKRAEAVLQASMGMSTERPPMIRNRVCQTCAGPGGRRWSNGECGDCRDVARAVWAERHPVDPDRLTFQQRRARGLA